MVDQIEKMSFYNGKNILITGSSGLLGSHIVDFLLSLSPKIRLLTRSPLIRPEKNITVFQGDVTESSVVTKAIKDVDIIFHLASLVSVDNSIKNPFETLNTNIMGTLQLLESARKQKKNPYIIFSSSTSVYCISHQEKVTEDSPITSSNPYSTSKAAADLICQAYIKTYNLPITILRTSTLYGPRQQRTQFIPNVISQSLSNRILELGSLNAYRDFCYVKDAAMAFMLAGASSEAVFEVFNISAGVSISLKEIVDKISTLLKKELCVKNKGDHRPGETLLPFVIDSSKAKRTLRWQPHYDLDSGLKETIEWFKAKYAKA